MPLSPLEYLRHMLDEAEYLIVKKQGLSIYRLYNLEGVFNPCA